MGGLFPVLTSVGLVSGIAIISWPILKMRGWVGSVLSGATAGLVLVLGPLLIPPERVMTRALISLGSADLFFKLIDYARENRRGGGGRWGDYLRFLAPLPVFLVVFRNRGRRLPAPVPTRPEIVRVLVGTAVASACVAEVIAGGGVAVSASFALNHMFRLAVFVVTIEAASEAMGGLERLAGFDIRPIIRSCFLARTPLEFWSRYNTRVHSWLESNLFRPMGGRRAPIRAVLATFFVSAVFHELMFDLALSRVDGSQFAFFMIQAPAVLASPRLERFARRSGVAGDALARSLTVVWMSVSSTLFFRGASRIFPFLDANPSWFR